MSAHSRHVDCTRAGVHGRNQLETRRKTHAILRPGNHNKAAFHGLSQDFQHLAIKLGEFIEKQHAVMGQGDFPGPGFGAAVGFLNSCESSRLEAAKYGF